MNKFQFVGVPPHMWVLKLVCLSSNSKSAMYYVCDLDKLGNFFVLPFPSLNGENKNTYLINYSED